MDQPPVAKGTRQLDPAHPEHETDDQPSARTSIGETAAVESAPVQHKGRKGFLPIRTNTFDRVFISVVIFIAVHLLWMRFIEIYLPLWIATLLSIALGIWIVRRG